MRILATMIVCLCSMAAAQGQTTEIQNQDTLDNFPSHVETAVGRFPNLGSHRYATVCRQDGRQIVVWMDGNCRAHEVTFADRSGQLCVAGTPHTVNGRLRFTKHNGSTFEWSCVQLCHEELILCFGSYLEADLCGRLWPKLGWHYQPRTVTTSKWVWSRIVPAQLNGTIETEEQPIQQRQPEQQRGPTLYSPASTAMVR